jgi:hypothetical protein
MYNKYKVKEVREQNMTTYSVTILTRALEKHTYLINAGSAESAKKKALDKLYSHIGMMVPCKKVTVSKIEDLWVPMG